jgi:beta-galactosidase
MHGVKAFNYYMAVERDRWLGSPVGRRGDVREERAAIFRKLLAFLEETDWANVERRVDFLLLHVRDYDRLRFAARIASPPFFPDQLGPLEALARHEAVAPAPFPGTDDSWFREAYETLSRNHLQFAVGDTESDLEWLQRFPVLVAPAYELMSREIQTKLRRYVDEGGRLVLGPRLPSWNEHMEPMTLLHDAVTVSSASNLARELRNLGLAPPFELDNPRIDVAHHVGATEDYLFIANRSLVPQMCTLRWPGAREFRDLWSSRRVLPSDELELAFQPYEIQIWSVRC